ncbi:hypothetical protein [Bacillus alkalisoli]|uniref:hypothetical protein n=1 Tax=Bacillus alkalisoli TaxID=2011008 RepID=UPI000C23C154|nr:hypothetical protein [Bacillus alkalisoli]
MTVQDPIYQEFNELLKDISLELMNTTVFERIEANTSSFTRSMPELNRSINKLGELIRTIEATKNNSEETFKEVKKRFGILEETLKNFENQSKNNTNNSRKQLLENLENVKKSVHDYTTSMEKKMDNNQEYLIQVLNEKHEKLMKLQYIQISISAISVGILIYVLAG